MDDVFTETLILLAFETMRVRISLQNLSFRVEYCYRYTKGDVYIMGMGHILY